MRILLIIFIVLLSFVIFMLYFPSIATRMLLNNFRKFSKKMVNDFVNQFVEIKMTNGELTDSEIRRQILNKMLLNGKELSLGVSHNLANDIRSQSILVGFSRTFEGSCYLIASIVMITKNSMAMRVAQLFGCIDYELSLHGIPPCSLEEKREVYRKFGLSDLFERNPDLFKFH